MKKYCFGADIGGTTIKIGLFSATGILLEKWEIPTRKEERGAYLLEDVAAELSRKMEERGIAKEDILGVGLDAPGPVGSNGVIQGCVNLGWGVFNLVETFRKLSGFSLIKAGNDAKVAALGEYYQGVGDKKGTMVLVTLGTGIGGGIILDGKVLMGTNGAAGEIGHLVVNPEEVDACNCGKHGCLEQIASATGMVRTAKRFLQESDLPSILRSVVALSAKDVLDGAKAGDVLANEIVEYVCKYLGMGLANVSCVVDTDKIVIGGGVSKAGVFLLDKLKRYYNVFAFSPCRNKKIELATLGNDAGIYGCAQLILEEEE